MILTPFYVICGLICLFWLVVHSILAARQEPFKVLAFLFLSTFFAAAGDVLLGSITGSKTISHLVILLFVPAVIPLNCLYLAHISRHIQFRPFHFIWVVIPAVFFTAGLVISIIKGFDQTDILLDKLLFYRQPGVEHTLVGVDKIFYLWNFAGLRIVMVLEVITLIVYFIVMSIRYHFRPSNLFGFLFKGRKILFLEIQMTLSLLILIGFSIKLFLYKPYLTLHPAFTISVVLVAATLLFFFGLFALFGSREYITLKNLSKALRFNYSEEDKSTVTEEMVMEMVEDLNAESLTKVISKMVIRTDSPSEKKDARTQDTPSLTSALFKNAKSWDEGSLVSRFQRLMTDEQLFLQPGLNLDRVAVRLKSNKTYISKMVNQTYGIGFPEVLNILRVDFAQQYMQKHKDASQEEVARASGFLSASSFNTTFKRITGYTPKVWSSRK